MSTQESTPGIREAEEHVAAARALLKAANVLDRCPRCVGLGMVDASRSIDPQDEEPVDCSACRGTGVNEPLPGADEGLYRSDGDEQAAEDAAWVFDGGEF